VTWGEQRLMHLIGTTRFLWQATLLLFLWDADVLTLPCKKATSVLCLQALHSCVPST